MPALEVHIWLKSLAAAAIGGGATAAFSIIGTGETLDYHQIGTVFLSGAVVSVISYLARSPLPHPDAQEGGRRASDPPLKPFKP